MSKKGSFKALLSGKCPACQEGRIFKFPISHISHFAEMNTTCEKCGAGFFPEPGFYFGAMYITYAFNVALLIAFGLIMLYWIALPDWMDIVLIALVAALTTPFSFRASRIIWLYWFGGLQSKVE